MHCIYCVDLVGIVINCWLGWVDAGTAHIGNTVSLDATPLKCMPPPQKCTWSRCNLDLCPLTLETFPAKPSHRLLVAGFIKISPLITEISRHAKQVLRDNGWRI